MAATSARNYDVFLSFRGEDTRKNFTDHLFASLVRHGFSTFRDDEELERGEEIGLEQLKAIEESRVSVIVLSKNYAASRWCLDELAKIMECKSTFQQMVVPIFFDVNPSDVRAQRGTFAEAFARHEEHYKGRGMEIKLERWRAALTEAANLSGWDLQTVDVGRMSKFIEKIVEDILNKLSLPSLDVAKYPVGIESRVQHVNMLLSLESDDVRMVGIWGIGGIGKSTIAKAIYNLIRPKFEGSSFLANVRETSKQPNGLVGLQEQLLFDILTIKKRSIRNIDQGIEVLKQRLWCKRVLLVLDDVDQFHQLKALAIRRDWFHSGSRVLITTRDESLLTSLEVDGVYMPSLLSPYESFKLFSWHAFNKDHPKEDYVGLSWEVVRYAGGLPLVIEVLGSFLFGRAIPEWKSALEKLRVIPDDVIQEKLRTSFDSLTDEEKDLFLDIACFFVGMDKKYTTKILEGCGYFPEIGLAVLSHRCLVRIQGDLLTMPGLLRDMGRDIVRRECPKEPGKRSRLWFHEDVIDVLTNYTGTEVVEGIILNLPRLNDVRLNAEAFAKMNRLRLLKLNYVHLSGSFEHLSKRLRWLCWFGFPLISIPSNLFMEKVVVIDMRYSCLKRVWRGRKILSKLKILNLSHSYHLIETPDFSGCTSLEMLLLNDCTRLVEVHQSIECLDKLIVLDLNNCKNLRKLPLGIWKLTSLQNLSLSACSKLEKHPGFIGSQSKSRFSSFSSWASPVRIPDSNSPSPVSMKGLVSLKKLDLADCNLSYLPVELGSLVLLKWLNLARNSFHTLPASINHLSRLKGLSLSGCKSLQSLPELPVNLKMVDARYCRALERISTGTDFRKSPFLYFPGCHKLVEHILACNFRKSYLQNQELDAVGGFSILFPGGEFPYYFNYWSVGSVLSFVVSLLPDQRIHGWTLCVVIAGCINERIAEPDAISAYPLLYQVKNKTKGFKRYYGPAFHGRPLYHQDHTWLHYAPQHYLELQMEAGDEVEYSVFVTDHTQIPVKKFGVNLIYEDDEKNILSNDQPMIQYAFPSYPNVILDKHVSEYQAYADKRKLRHQLDGVQLDMSVLVLCLLTFQLFL